MELLNNFSQIEIESPADKIIRQIKDLISSGQLKPGDKLPSERMMCERLGVGRTHLRDALKKLEFYGILKTLPQSGTVVAGMGLPALEGLITDMLSLHDNDFKSLVETRVILETNSAMLAAKNRTVDDLVEIEHALMAHKEKVKVDGFAVEEDLLFHLKISEAGKNSVLKSLMLIITPDIMSYFKTHNVCGDGRSETAVEHHEIILKHIKNQDAQAAGEAVRHHLKDIVEYVNTPNTKPSTNGVNQ
ncbi:MAG: FadR/GntR family transcriptional regulator [Cyclobacteriaceae bacterium]